MPLLDPANQLVQGMSVQPGHSIAENVVPMAEVAAMLLAQYLESERRIGFSGYLNVRLDRIISQRFKTYHLRRLHHSKHNLCLNQTK